MAVVLGDNQYGKAEVRLVHVARGADRHDVTDLTVSVALAGDFADVHLRGDNSGVVATDSQKNIVYAFAREHGVGQIEEFGELLARHFVESYPHIHRASVAIEQHSWQRISVDGEPHPHSFAAAGGESRTTTVTAEGSAVWFVSGLTGLVLLKSTASEFAGFVRDRFTTLAETDDRILASAVTARWRHGAAPADWEPSFADVRRGLVETFATQHSLSLQQTLYAMGAAVLEEQPGVAEIRLSMPNKHHILVDLAPFGLDNPDQVYVATDRPYGLIEGTVTRDDAPDAGPAWHE
ncbi:MAG: urate oxidase [Mycobacteriales bacterium]